MINRWVLLFGDKTVTLHVHIQLVKKQSQVGTFLIKLTFIPVKVTLCNLMVLLECPVNEQRSSHQHAFFGGLCGYDGIEHHRKTLYHYISWLCNLHVILKKAGYYYIYSFL